MLVHRKASLAAALTLSASAAFAQEQTFNVYGFADAAYNKSTMEKNHFLYFFVNDNLDWGIKHFNLYFDYKPNQFSRALLEVGFINQTDIQGKVAEDLIINTEITGVPSALAPALAAQGFRATRTDTAKFPTPKSISAPFIERAYFEILLNSKLNFRIGRFITPAGIWNVDHGSPVILPVKQPYQTTVIPIFPERQDGVTLFGNGYFGDHDYEYSVYASTGSDPDNNKLRGIQDLSGGGKAALRLDLPVKVKLGLSGYSGLTRSTKVYGVATRQIPYAAISSPNAALGGAATPDPAKLIPAMSMPPAFSDVYYETQVRLQDRHLAWGLDGRFDIKGAFLQTEFNQRISTNELNESAKDAVFTGYYAIVGYKHPLNEKVALTPYLMYEGLEWKDITGVPSAAGFGQLPMDGFDAFIGGVNVGLFGNVYVKVEYTYSMMRDLKSPPAIPMMVLNYDDGETDISTFSTQFAIAF